MSQSPKSKPTASPKSASPQRPAPKDGGLTSHSGAPASSLGGNALQGGSLGSTSPSSGLMGGKGTHGLPSAKGTGLPKSNIAAKPGQKPGGKPTGVPRRTAG